MSKQAVSYMVEPDPSEHALYLKIGEVAKRFRVSVDTIRRHILKGKMKEIVWGDFLSNGKLLATRESVEEFEKARLAATEKIYSR